MVYNQRRNAGNGSINPGYDLDYIQRIPDDDDQNQDTSTSNHTGYLLGQLVLWIMWFLVTLIWLVCLTQTVYSSYVEGQEVARDVLNLNKLVANISKRG